MTLIAVNYFQGRFWGLSDSRVSHKPNGETSKITDRFTKMYLVPFRFTSGPEKDAYLHDLSGRVGFAFAGDVLAALAIQAMTGHILENMHDADGTSEPADFDTILSVFLRAAELLHDETAINARPYEAFIFGFCPKTSLPRLGLLTLQMENGVFRFATVDMPLSDGMTHSIGSGAPFFRDLVQRPANAARLVEDIFLEAVLNNSDKATGGAVQLMVVYPERASYAGVLQADQTRDQVEIYVSGVGNSELGEIGGYQLGREVIGIAAHEVLYRQNIRKEGFDPDANDLRDDVRNRINFLFLLRKAARSETETVRFDKAFEVDAPIPQKGVHYFSTFCKKCFLLTPLLVDPSCAERGDLCVGGGEMLSKCIHCGERVSLRSWEMKGRLWA